MPESNKRRNTRVRFETTADLFFTDQTIANCSTTNLSINGIMIVGLQGRALGEECELRLHLGGGKSDLIVAIKCKVSRITEEGTALHFYEIELDSFQHLKNIVYYNSENPDDVSKEYIDHRSIEDIAVPAKHQ
jgi:hypothetical protein